MRHMRTLMVALCIMATAPSPARACSVAKGYRVPSTLELADRSDTIVLARVVGERVHSLGEYRKVQLVPFELLKGAALPPKFDLEDAAISGGDLRTVPSDPRELVNAHPDVFSGSCNRTVFNEGMTLVVFLRRVEGKLVVYAPPFSRTLEDVPSSNALWVKAVRLYIEIAASPVDQRFAGMQRRRDLFKGDIGDADASFLALELDRALLQTH